MFELVARWTEGDRVRDAATQGSPVVGLGVEWSDRVEGLLANLEPPPRRLVPSNISGVPDEVSDVDPGDASSPATWAAGQTAGSVIQEPAQGPATAAREIGRCGGGRLRSVL